MYPHIFGISDNINEIRASSLTCRDGEPSPFRASRTRAVHLTKSLRRGGQTSRSLLRLVVAHTIVASSWPLLKASISRGQSIPGKVARRTAPQPYLLPSTRTSASLASSPALNSASRDELMGRCSARDTNGGLWFRLACPGRSIGAGTGNTRFARMLSPNPLEVGALEGLSAGESSESWELLLVLRSLRKVGGP